MSHELLAAPQTITVGPLSPEVMPYFTRDRNKRVSDGLRELPCISQLAIEHRFAQTQTVQQSFPVERLIANSRDAPWSGEGSVKRLADGQQMESAVYASQLATVRAYETAAKPVSIRLFQDEVGEIWGMVADGTHRVMAAKINGATEIPAMVSIPLNPMDIDTYPGDVITERLVGISVAA
jgi:hypothetical protein